MSLSLLQLQLTCAEAFKGSSIPQLQAFALSLQVGSPQSHNMRSQHVRRAKVQRAPKAQGPRPDAHLPCQAAQRQALLTTPYTSQILPCLCRSSEHPMPKDRALMPTFPVRQSNDKLS